MTSIATKTGDSGQTSLIGGLRVSKAAPRVEAYGALDELNSSIGFARSITNNQAICASTLRIQRELFTLGAILATPGNAAKNPAPLDPAMIDALTEEVHALEASEAILRDWSVPGGCPQGAAFDVARTVCRRAERCAVVLMESGEPVPPLVLHYLNRLSDLLWLFGRKLEVDAGAQSPLRSPEGKQTSPWSRA